jgi:hypothetical protein
MDDTKTASGGLFVCESCLPRLFAKAFTYKGFCLHGLCFNKGCALKKALSKGGMIR